MSRYEMICSSAMAGKRLDQFLAEELPDLSRSYLQKICKTEGVLVNGKTARPNCKLKAGDSILLDIPEPKELEVLPQEIPLDILYEDKDLLIVNKPKDMVVHPAAGHEDGTLVNAVLHHCRGQLSGINGVLRPGIVHRIDKDTTGSLVICKTDEAHKKLAEDLSVHNITRRYRAICIGHLPEENMAVHTTIGRDPKDRKKMAVNVPNGKEAVTHIQVLERLNGYDYVECSLETGRTHQIRVHLSHLRHPILGDEIYGHPVKEEKQLQGQCLHAMTIGFRHPVTEEDLEVSAPIPAYFEKLLSKYRLK